MHRGLRWAAVVAALGVGVVAGAAPAAGGPAGVDLEVAKRKHGTYAEAVNRNLSPGQRKSVFARATNGGGDPEQVRLVAPSFVAPYKLKYFKANGTDITSAVTTGAGYGFSLGAGKAKRFEVRIKLPAAASPDAACLLPAVTWDEGAAQDYAQVTLNGGTCA